MSSRTMALSVLTNACIPPHQPFDSLTEQQLLAVTAETSAMYEKKHGKPIPKGSRELIRKRYALLQKRAHP